MSKLMNLDVVESLEPFRNALGKSFDKVVSDIKSILGREEKNMKVEQSDWKATARFQLKSKEGYTLQLPLNNPVSTLLCFGMRLNELAANGGFDVEADIPKNCLAWVEAHSKAVETAPVIA